MNIPANESSYIAQQMEQKQRQIYTFDSPLPVYSIDWSYRKDKPYRLAFSSFEVKSQNSITVVQLDDESNSLKETASVPQQYPATKVMWMPYNGTDKADLFASTGDILSIYEIKDDKAKVKCQLNSVCSNSYS